MSWIPTLLCLCYSPCVISTRLAFGAGQRRQLMWEQKNISIDFKNWLFLLIGAFSKCILSNYCLSHGSKALQVQVFNPVVDSWQTLFILSVLLSGSLHYWSFRMFIALIYSSSFFHQVSVSLCVSTSHPWYLNKCCSFCNLLLLWFFCFFFFFGIITPPP